MSISPAIRFVFALAVALLSAAPVSAREREPASPQVWAPGAERLEALVSVDPGVGSASPVSRPCYATPNDGTTVFTSTIDAQAVRDALAAVAANGTVKIAGYCSGVATQGGTIQTALITQTITLAGGYTTTDWTTYNPAGNPTTLDALAGGRVISAPVAATLRGFTVTGGYISSTLSLNGGGINAAGALTLSEMIVSGNTITGAASTLNGGGAYIGGPASVANTTFSNNAAKRSGGGLYAATTLALTDTQFLTNSLDLTTNSAGGGATVRGALTVVGGLFQGNRAGGQGGGLVASASFVVTGTRFVGNVGANGGGLLAQALGTVTNAEFISNTGTSSGGGLQTSSALTLTNATIRGKVPPLAAVSMPVVRRISRSWGG